MVRKTRDFFGVMALDIFKLRESIMYKKGA